MKKNLMSVLILALVVVNLVLTAILTISVLPQTQKANELITQVCSAINLELQSGEVKDLSSVPIDQIATYDLPDSMTINFKKDADGKAHYVSLNITVSMDNTTEGYSKYGETMSERQTLIEDAVNSTITQYTMEEFNADQEAVKKEVTKALQKLFDSDFIIGVAFSKVTSS